MAVSTQAKAGCDLQLGPEQDIFAAINKVKNGSVVCLKPGRYTGGNIERSVTIRPLGKQGKVVFSDSLLVNWTDVKHPLHIMLDGLEFEQAGKDWEGAVSVRGRNFRYHPSVKVVISNCIFKGNNLKGIGGADIQVFDANVSVKNSIFKHGRTGSNGRHDSIKVDGISVLSVHNSLFVHRGSRSEFIIRADRLSKVKIYFSTFVSNAYSHPLSVVPETELVVKDSVFNCEISLPEKAVVQRCVVPKLLDLTGIDRFKHIDPSVVQAMPHFVGTGRCPFALAPDSPGRGMAKAGDEYGAGDMCGRPRTGKVNPGCCN